MRLQACPESGPAWGLEEFQHAGRAVGRCRVTIPTDRNEDRNDYLCDSRGVQAWFGRWVQMRCTAIVAFTVRRMCIACLCYQL